MSNDHLSLDELAELDEGILPPERTSALRAHLHGCAECRSRAEAITSTRSILSDLPAIPMPADVIARLDAAFADAASPVPEPREQAEDDTSWADDEDADVLDLAARTATVTPPPGSVSRPRFGRPTGPTMAVAAVFVLAAGAIVIGSLGHHHSPSVNSTAGTSAAVPQAGEDIVPPGNANANVTITSSGTRYTATNLASDVQGLLHRAPTESVVPSPNSPLSTFGTSNSTPGTPIAGTGGGASTDGAGTSNSSSKGPNHQDSTRRSGKKSQTTSVGSGPAVSTTVEAPAAAPTPKALRGLARSRKAILQCAQNLTGQLNAVPLQVDFARWTGGQYKNAPSAIFVFPAKTANTVIVIVTDPSCSGTGQFRTYQEIGLP